MYSDDINMAELSNDEQKNSNTTNINEAQQKLPQISGVLQQVYGDPVAQAKSPIPSNQSELEDTTNDSDVDMEPVVKFDFACYGQGQSPQAAPCQQQTSPPCFKPTAQPVYEQSRHEEYIQQPNTNGGLFYTSSNNWCQQQQQQLYQQYFYHQQHQQSQQQNYQQVQQPQYQTTLSQGSPFRPVIIYQGGQQVTYPQPQQQLPQQAISYNWPLHAATASMMTQASPASSPPQKSLSKQEQEACSTDVQGFSGGCTASDEPKEKPIKKKKQSYQNQVSRSSKFTGVSRNGKMWQVQIGSVSGKRYMGRFDNEIDAAKCYDKYKIMQKGIDAKTNFQYTKEEIEKILEEKDEE